MFLLDAQEENSWRTYKLGPKTYVRTGDFSADGTYVALIRSHSRAEDRPYRAEYTDELEVWDYKAARVVVRKTLRQVIVYSQLEFTGRSDTRYLRYLRDGRFLVAFDGATVYVLETAKYDQVREFKWGTLPANDVWRADSVAVSPDGAKIAGLFHAVNPQSGTEKRAGGLLQVMDLTSGQLIWEREFDGDQAFMFELAWSVDGAKLAVTTAPAITRPPLPSYVHNLYVFDAISGRVTLLLNTGHIAVPVAFGTNNTLLTASAYIQAEKHPEKDTIKVWDADTGRLLREILSPPGGVHAHLETSFDGRVILGDVGRSRYSPLAHADMTVSQRFRLWDLATGHVMATSPEILPRDSEPFGTRMMLNCKGDAVLVWLDMDATPAVYEFH